MKYILMTILSILLLSPISANKIGTKFCINCKFYQKSFFTFSEFGKCTMFPRKQTNDNYLDYLVNGKNVTKNVEYYYCSTVRQNDNMCGEEGNFYEEKL